MERRRPRAKIGSHIYHVSTIRERLMSATRAMERDDDVAVRPGVKRPNPRYDCVPSRLPSLGRRSRSTH